MAWIIAAICLFVFIPKEKVRLAWVAFLFKQFIAWPLGLLAVNIGLLEYPVRLFENVYKSSFTFEYFVYPAICALFTTYYPKGKSIWIKSGYYSLFCSGMTAVELILLHYTNLIRYIHWNAYFTWLSIFVTLYITQRFCTWFFRDSKSV
jgi:hypothetical protein